MDFQDFVQYLPLLKATDLSLIETQSKLSRLNYIKSNSTDLLPRLAAVLMLCYPKKGKTYLVLIIRNEYIGVHSSQIAFPGGKYEDSDSNFSMTALRETYEEIGIHPNKVEIIRPYSQIYIPISNFIVHPFLGISQNEIDFIPNPSEVAQIIELPISHLLSDTFVLKNDSDTTKINSTEFPQFKFDNHIIWGATAIILNELKEHLKKILNQ